MSANKPIRRHDKRLASQMRLIRKTRHTLRILNNLIGLGAKTHAGYLEECPRETRGLKKKFIVQYLLSQVAEKILKLKNILDHDSSADLCTRCGKKLT